MVSISRETTAQIDVRLRAVLRAAALEWLPGSWQFLDDSDSILDDAIALIRGQGQTSALAPAHTSRLGGERFGVFRVNFTDVDNSGFVGWLASSIKEATGSGVFVICGFDAGRGGIFDYWGVPEAVSDQVRTLLERLAGHRRLGSLDGVAMRPTITAANARITSHTVFSFQQEGSAVTAMYGGGNIASGRLAGTQSGDTISFRYLQTEFDGTVDSGSSVAELHQLTDGRWRIVEHFAWDSRSDAGANHLEEIPKHAHLTVSS